MAYVATFNHMNHASSYIQPPSPPVSQPQKLLQPLGIPQIGRCNAIAQYHHAQLLQTLDIVQNESRVSPIFNVKWVIIKIHENELPQT